MGLDKELCVDGRIKGLARKLARRIGGEGTLPPEIEVPAKSDEWAVIPDVGRILGVAAYQKGRKAVFRIPPERRDTSGWAEVRAVFSKKESAGDPAEEAYRRARLIAGAEAVEALKADESVARFLRRDEGTVRDFIRMLEWAADRVAHDAAMPAVTLSQLGADILGDSKSLRAGARRAAFGRILSAVAGMDADECGREAFAMFGVDENPFTSFVTVFAPFSFTLDSGETFRHPIEMFRSGLAAQLPRQTVMRMRDVGIEADSIVTSENAAPFEALVRGGVPCLYTEGYPNAAVIRLLELFAARGMQATHAGDGDLYGYIIADRISRAIRVRRVIADEFAADESLPRRPVSPQARRRWEAYLAAHRDFAHASSLRIAIDRGWIEQESMSCAGSIANAASTDIADGKAFSCVREE